MTRLGPVRRFYTTPTGTVIHEDPMCGYLTHSRTLHCWTRTEAESSTKAPCKVCKPSLILHPTRG